MSSLPALRQAFPPRLDADRFECSHPGRKMESPWCVDFATVPCLDSCRLRGSAPKEIVIVYTTLEFR